MHVSHGTRILNKKGIWVISILFAWTHRFEFRLVKPNIGCSRTVFGLFKASPAPFFSSPFFAVGGASEQNLSCPFAVVETQKLVVVSADAGRNSWFVAM